MKFEEETRSILSCAFEVGNTLGHGLWEKCYENALVVEIGLRGISVDQQKTFDVLYKEAKVGTYVPDLIAFDKIIIDTKTIDRFTDHEVGQMLN